MVIKDDVRNTDKVKIISEEVYIQIYSTFLGKQIMGYKIYLEVIVRFDVDRNSWQATKLLTRR